MRCRRGGGGAGLPGDADRSLDSVRKVRASPGEWQGHLGREGSDQVAEVGSRAQEVTNRSEHGQVRAELVQTLGRAHASVCTTLDPHQGPELRPISRWPTLAAFSGEKRPSMVSP